MTKAACLTPAEILKVDLKAVERRIELLTQRMADTHPGLKRYEDLAARRAALMPYRRDLLTRIAALACSA